MVTIWESPVLNTICFSNKKMKKSYSCLPGDVEGRASSIVAVLYSEYKSTGLSSERNDGQGFSGRSVFGREQTKAVYINHRSNKIEWALYVLYNTVFVCIFCGIRKSFEKSR